MLDIKENINLAQYSTFHVGGLARYFVTIKNIDELKNQEECIKLMTMHSSKGLEFDYVFLIGVVDGIIPSNKTISEHQNNGVEQERRLMYVAMTRARKELFLLSSKVLTWGNSSNFDFPSRFVKESGLKA